MKNLLIVTAITLSVSACTLKSKSYSNIQQESAQAEAIAAPPPPVLSSYATPIDYASPASAPEPAPYQPPRYVPMDAGATPPILQATPASQAAISGTSAPVPQATSYAAPATISGVKESVYLPQYRSDLQPVAPRAQNGWVLMQDPYLADYRAKRGY